MATKGRKTILTEEETKNIIENYILTSNNKKKILHIEIHNFCVNLFNKKEIKVAPSESFWRKKDRLGRKMIDYYNNTFYSNNLLSVNNSDSIKLLNIIDNSIDDNQIKNLIINELEKKQKQINSLEKIVSEKELDILSSKKDINQLTILNKNQQELLTQSLYFFLQLQSSENSIFFDSAFKNIFSTPSDFIDLIFDTKDTNKNNILTSFLKNRLE